MDPVRFFEAAVRAAKVDLHRKKKREKRIAKKTVYLEDLLEEPSVPSFLGEVMTREMLAGFAAQAARKHGMERLLGMLLSGMTVAEIADFLGVCCRTANRSLAGLRQSLVVPE